MSGGWVLSWGCSRPHQQRDIPSTHTHTLGFRLSPQLCGERDNQKEEEARTAPAWVGAPLGNCRIF